MAEQNKELQEFERNEPNEELDASEELEQATELRDDKESGQENALEENKAKRAYGLVIIKEDSQKGISKKFIDTTTIKKGFSLLIAVLIIGLLFSAFWAVRLLIMNHSVTNLESELSTTQTKMNQTVEDLQSENTALSDKLAILSNQMTQAMEKEEEQAERRIPTGLPVSGRVNVLEENALAPNKSSETLEESEDNKKDNASENVSETELLEEEEVEYLTLFEVLRGSIVMSSADGTVMTITEDFEYGKALWIDHGNGYQTVYYYNGEPKVKEGDEVLRGTLLFEVERKKGKVGYQIIQDGYYINPLNLMAISG